MKIMLVCAGGMSTSILVSKMKQEAKNRDMNVDIWAISVNSYYEEFDKADIILLAPQIKFQLNEFKEIADTKNIKVDVIDMLDYGMMKANKVLDKCIDILKGVE